MIDDEIIGNNKNLIDKLKNSTDQDHEDSELNLSNTINLEELNTKSFNEVDYAAMLFNTHIKMATRDLAKNINFSNPILLRLRDLILDDESGSSQRVISQLFIQYPGSNLDTIKSKLDYYNQLKNRDDINHYLDKLNVRIKRNVLENSLSGYFNDKNMDKLISSIDQLTNNIHNSIIPFIKLDSLKLKDIRDSFDESNKLQSSIDFINRCSNYKALLKSQLVIVAAPPGTGKTQFLLNEAYHHAKNGFRIAYLAMGDALQSDFTIKLGCLHFKVNIDEFINNIENYIDDKEFKEILSRINLSVVSAGEISSLDAKNFFKSDKKLYDCDAYFFDYDSNFSELSKYEMYIAHDKIYNNIYSLARLDQPKLVYIASQVKTHCYGKEFIPLHGLAESNRKQAIADYVITISGIRNGNDNCGIINVVKARRGILGYAPYQLTEFGKMVEIGMDKYNSIKSKIASHSSYKYDDYDED